MIENVAGFGVFVVLIYIGIKTGFLKEILNKLSFYGIKINELKGMYNHENSDDKKNFRKLIKQRIRSNKKNDEVI